MKPIFSLSHLTHPLDKQWIIEWYSSRNAYLMKPSCSAGHLNHIFRSAYGSNVVLVFCIPREGIQCQMWRRWKCKDITSPILQAHVRIYGRWDFNGCHFQKTLLLWCHYVIHSSGLIYHGRLCGLISAWMFLVGIERCRHETEDHSFGGTWSFGKDCKPQRAECR